MLQKMAADHTPSYHAAVFDLGAPRKRLTLLPSYKAQRPPTPPDLDRQLPVIRDMLEAMRVPLVETEGEEADDIVATLAVRAAAADHPVLIASNDKDFMQLVSSRIRLLRPDGRNPPSLIRKASENDMASRRGRSSIFSACWVIPWIIFRVRWA